MDGRYNHRNRRKYSPKVHIVLVLSIASRYLKALSLTMLNKRYTIYVQLRSKLSHAFVKFRHLAISSNFFPVSL